MNYAFVHRRPWATTIVSLLFGPTIGMFYLGKGREGLAYLLIETSAYFLPVVAVHLEILSLDIEMTRGLSNIVIRIVGILHCYYISKRLHDRVPLVWFARWYSIIGMFLVPALFAAIVLRSFDL